MKSQYSSPSQVAASALKYVFVGSRVVKLHISSISWSESIVRYLLHNVLHLPYAIKYLLYALLICTSTAE